MSVFKSADLILPMQGNEEKWSVIACDQFTSQPEYWEAAGKIADGAMSSLHMILPEAYLNKSGEEKFHDIHENMDRFLSDGLFRSFSDAYVYVERTLCNGTVRRGVVGVIDLEAYDFSDDAASAIRATEKTVQERIPPRMKTRLDASVDFSHVLLLMDDNGKKVIESLTAEKEQMSCVYDFDLMLDGGHIRGYLLEDGVRDRFEKRLYEYEAERKKMNENALLYVVGDGNHSLATAKKCYETEKERNPERNVQDSPLRYALVELENLHDDTLVFEPIHRLIRNCNVQDLVSGLHRLSDPNGSECTWVSGADSGRFKAGSGLAVASVQNFLDYYLADHPGEIDYIHDDDVLIRLASEQGAAGILLPPIAKKDLFTGIQNDGVLPRKTFSMGHAREKRYYLECRKLRNPGRKNAD